MRIAFDLDDTLIPCSFPFPVERPTFTARLLGAEPLRRGAVALLKQLRRQGCEVWVYTTSQRRPFSVRLQFWAYGARLGGVVNSDCHVRRLSNGWPDSRSVSKYPPAFGIDLLVDDLEGVILEGKRFGFSVLRVDPQDEGWADLVRAAVERRRGT